MHAEGSPPLWVGVVIVQSLVSWSLTRVGNWQCLGATAVVHWGSVAWGEEEGSNLSRLASSLTSNLSSSACPLADIGLSLPLEAEAAMDWHALSLKAVRMSLWQSDKQAVKTYKLENSFQGWGWMREVRSDRNSWEWNNQQGYQHK